MARQKIGFSNTAAKNILDELLATAVSNKKLFTYLFLLVSYHVTAIAIYVAVASRYTNENGDGDAGLFWLTTGVWVAVSVFSHNLIILTFLNHIHSIYVNQKSQLATSLFRAMRRVDVLAFMTVFYSTIFLLAPALKISGNGRQKTAVKVGLFSLLADIFSVGLYFVVPTAAMDVQKNLFVVIKESFSTVKDRWRDVAGIVLSIRIQALASFFALLLPIYMLIASVLYVALGLISNFTSILPSDLDTETIIFLLPVGINIIVTLSITSLLSGYARLRYLHYGGDLTWLDHHSKSAPRHPFVATDTKVFIPIIGLYYVWKRSNEFINNKDYLGVVGSITQISLNILFLLISINLVQSAVQRFFN